MIFSDALGGRYVQASAADTHRVCHSHLHLTVTNYTTDYMNRRQVFTLDEERFPIDMMRELVDHLHNNDQHYIVMVDPALAYQDNPPLQRAIEDNILLLRANGSAWLGVVWPGVAVFPDWFAEGVDEYWTNEFSIFFDADKGVDIDALWIDMNEPSSFPCYFPCDAYASDDGYPPEPPPVREVPRPLPGWPCSFQPPGSDCNNGSTSSVSKREPERFEPLPRDFKSDSLVLHTRAGKGDQKGLPGRDLLFPEYAIHNKAAYMDSWNAEEGGISNKTVQTDVIAQNGLAQYDSEYSQLPTTTEIMTDSRKRTTCMEAK